MILKLLRKLGAVKTTLIITAVSILSSVFLYMIIGIFLAEIAVTGIVMSIMIPAMVAPFLAYFFLRVSLKLDLAERELVKANAELELRVKQRTAELVKANEALQAEIAEHKQAKEALAQQAQELARSNAFITALSQVATHIGTTQDPDQVMETLGTELEKLGMTCLVGTLEADGQALVIRYTSMERALLAVGERVIGLEMLGFHITRERFPIWAELIEQGRAVFVPDAVVLIAAALPNVLQPVIERALRLGGWISDTPTIGLPLTVESRVVGALAMWGPDLREDDTPALSVFSSQVSAALEVARLYEAERKQTKELARASERLQTELTERVRAEEQTRVSLREKEVLLKEIHHRVKNNLQVISSLLYLQSKNTQDRQVLDMFQESQNRVRSMAFVHERLYQSPDLARVEFAEYAQSLANYLLRSYGVNTNVIRLKINVDDVSLGVDMAIPCGLIINELVSNSLKHAFPDGREGEIRIELRSDDGQFTLTVSDNGVSFPEDLDFRNTKTLGLQVVNTLVEQLEGTIDLDRSSGTAFKITFAALEQVGNRWLMASEAAEEGSCRTQNEI